MIRYLILVIALLIATTVQAEEPFFVSVYSWGATDYTNNDRSDFIRANYPKSRHKQYYIAHTADQTQAQTDAKSEFIWAEITRIKPTYILIYNSKAFSEIYVKRIVPAKMHNAIFYSVPTYIIDDHKEQLKGFPLRGSIIVNNTIDVFDQVCELGYDLKNIYMIRNPDNSRDTLARKELITLIGEKYTVSDYAIKTTKELTKVLNKIATADTGFLLQLTTDLIDNDTGKTVTYQKLARVLTDRNKKHFEVILYRNISIYGLASSLVLYLPLEKLLSADYIANKWLIDLIHGKPPTTYNFSYDIMLNRHRCYDLGFENVFKSKLSIGGIYE